MAEPLDELEDRDLARRLEGLARVEIDLNSRVEQQALALRGPAGQRADPVVHQRLMFLLYDVRRRIHAMTREMARRGALNDPNRAAVRIAREESL